MLSLLNTDHGSRAPDVKDTHSNFAHSVSHLSFRTQACPPFADFTHEKAEAWRGQVTFVQITPMSVSFMPPGSPNPSDSETFTVFPRLCQINLALLSNLTFPSLTSSTSRKRQRHGQQQTQNTMQKVLEHSVQGQKSPLHNSIALKTLSCYTTQ